MANNKVWHDAAQKPQDGKWVVAFNTMTNIPSVIVWHDCLTMQTGCIWAYLSDLLDMGAE